VGLCYFVGVLWAVFDVRVFSTDTLVFILYRAIFCVGFLGCIRAFLHSGLFS
jgi:hypothetical protein